MLVECKLELAKAYREAWGFMVLGYRWPDAVRKIANDCDLQDFLIAIGYQEIINVWAASYIDAYARYVEPRRLHQGKD